MPYTPSLPASASAALAAVGDYADTQDSALDARLDTLEAHGPAWVKYPEDYGAKGDVKQVHDANMSLSSQTLTSATAAFVSGDVGKLAVVRGAGLNTQGNTLVATITAVTNATTVTLSVAAAVAVTNTVLIWGTDDTAAIKSALNAAVAAANTAGGADPELVLTRAYMVGGAPVVGGSTAGNAQIPLPNRAPEVPKQRVSITCPTNRGAPLYHWAQTNAQIGGGTLVSTLLGQTSDATYGLPSVIGGPTSLPADSIGVAGRSNICAAIDGVTIIMPRNPSYIAVDLWRCAQMDIGSLACLAEGTPLSGQPGQLASPANSNGLGLRVPLLGNNDLVNIDSLSVEGFFYGIAMADHLTVKRIATIYCDTAAFVGLSGVAEHGISIQYWSCEATNTGIEAQGSAGGKMPIFISRFDVEVAGGGVTFRDSNSVLTGEVHYSHNQSTPPTRVGATNLRIIDDNRLRGAFTAPSVPASTVAVTDANMPWRDAHVVITGGTVTAIVVDGQTIFTSTAQDRVVMVPTGKTISITYSVAPTWKWTLI
jgi:hypothetical protein